MSVVIPAFNAEAHVGRAIESVLAQDFIDWELILVDDGSTDSTADVVQRYDRVRYDRVEHGGANRARNRAILNSRGELVAFLDADDTWQPEKLRLQATALQAQPEVGASFVGTCNVDEITGRTWIRPRSSHEDPVAGLLLHSNFLGPTSAAMVRRDLLLQVGLFDESLTQSQDWELWLRLAKVTRFLLIPEPLVIYRMHGENMTRNVARFEANALRVLNRFFADEENRVRWGHLEAQSYSNHYWFFAGGYFDMGDWKNGACALAQSLARDPSKLARFAPAISKRLRPRVSAL
ncbi:MAG TPA: glycosyltransferase [Chloroflexota bacterium]|nr:glycosyltransferase [Chloroflexota bacterium]